MIPTRALCFLLILAWVCHPEAAGEGDSTSSKERPFRLTGDEGDTELLDEFLRMTSPFRQGLSLPESKELTSEDLSSSTSTVIANPSMFEHTPWANGLFFWCDTKEGLKITGYVERPTGVLRMYVNADIREQLQALLRLGQWTGGTGLTPKLAIVKAKSYVAAVRGAFPDDLVPVSAFYCRPPSKGDLKRDPNWQAAMRPEAGCWMVEFQRFAGRFEYDKEGVRIRFSEHYGVAAYNDTYSSDTWNGEIKVGQEQALSLSKKPAQEYIETYAKGFRLWAPAYVFRGTPILMNVAKDKATEVHAVWLVVYPYTKSPKSANASEPFKGALHVYIDAQTGEYVEKE